MAPSMDILVEEEDVKMEKKKRKKFKDLSAVENFMAAADDSAKKKKKKRNNFENNSKSNVGVEEEAVLIQLIAKYLDKRNLQKTLSSFLSETRCKSSWKTQTKDLQDIYNQYSIQDNKNLKKHNVDDIDVEGEKNYLSIDNRNNNLKFLEEEVRTKDASKVVNSKVAPSSKGDLKISGALKPHVSGSDKSVTSCDDAQNELAKIKNKKRKAPGKDIDQDSDKTPKQTGSVKLEKSLQESLEVTKEEKMKKKYILDKNLIDNDEHKTSTCKENENSIKDNSKRSKTSLKQTDCGNLDNSSHESLELLKEAEKKKKKKNSDNKDLIDNDEKKKSTNIENGSPIKDKSMTSKTPPKKKNSGKLDKSLQEALEVPKEKKNKKNFEEKNLIDNNEKKISTERENRISIEGNRKLSKTSNKYKNILELNESVRGSLEVLRQKRIKEQDAEDKDSGDNDQQNSAEKNKKEKKELKKKLESSDSNVTNEEAIKRNLKDLAEDADKALGDNTPGQKGVKEDEREANFSSNSKQKSAEPTTAKAFQRVKVEEVQFVDPRLQDNSYWAKSGSDIGYGAKAEQVLGQVRGKDFRHEKTKKKRGSYKGGMIDMQSHSIKFSYSDDE